jgi:hypothetical protein
VQGQRTFAIGCLLAMTGMATGCAGAPDSRTTAVEAMPQEPAEPASPSEVPPDLEEVGSAVCADLAARSGPSLDEALAATGLSLRDRKQVRSIAEDVCPSLVPRAEVEELGSIAMAMEEANEAVAMMHLGGVVGVTEDCEPNVKTAIVGLHLVEDLPDAELRVAVRSMEGTLESIFIGCRLGYSSVSDLESWDANSLIVMVALERLIIEAEG